jgi:hypothetical protein
MFKKILIAEDLDSISITVEQALKELSITEIHHKYCDDALLKIKRPFMTRIMTLISDLSFKIDHRTNKLTSGDELIESVKNTTRH